MLPSAILGLGLLIGGVMLLRWYANADPAALKRAGKWIGIALLGVIVLFLALTGRFGAALGLFMGVVAFGWRLFNMVAMVRQMTGLFGGLGGFGPFGGAGPQASAGQASQVDAAYLRMSLDHDSGRMDGQVLEGKFKGRSLSVMGINDLLALRQEVSGDHDSLSLLEAYLDRAHVGWRDEAGAQQGEEGQGDRPSGQSSGPMTRDEAYRVLGLDSGADAKAIKSAYRHLMAKMHPDRGGSPYLAAKINEAKDILLKS